MGFLVIAALYLPTFAVVMLREKVRSPFAAAPPGRLLLRAGVPSVVPYAALVAMFLVTSLGNDLPIARVNAEPGLPAAAAGIRDGDRVVAVDGQPIRWFQQINEARESARTSPSTLSLERGAERLSVTVTPTPEGLLGLKWAGEREPMPLGEMLASCVAAPIQVFVEAVKAMRSVAVGTLSPRQAVGGPSALVQLRSSPLLALVAVQGSVFWPLTVVLGIVVVVLGTLHSRSGPRTG